MVIGDAINAFAALIKILFLPAAVMLGVGIYWWYQGSKLRNKDRLRLGKMLAMFGIIFMVILQVVYWVLIMQFGIEQNS